MRHITITLTLASAALFLGGCSDAIENHATDNAFIREPDALTQPAPTDNKTVFPTAIGSTWTFAVHSISSSGSHPESRETREVKRVVGTTTINGRSGTIIEVQEDGQPPRREIYEDTADALNLLASGPVGRMMTLSPPFTLFHKPIQAGEAIEWPSGILQYNDRSTPGQGLSRITRARTFKVSGREVNAYRVDALILTTVEGRQVALPSVVCLSPGIGPVYEKAQRGDDIIEKVLMSYTSGTKQP